MASDRQPARSTTPRGFTVYDEFGDTRGVRIRVQQSSIAAYDGLWIFAGGQLQTEGMPLHLNVEQATWLRDALDTFIREQDQGEVPDGQ